MVRDFLKSLEAKGWKQKEIAEKTGLCRPYITLLFQGKNCSLETVIKFADAFGVSTDTVLGREVKSPLSKTEELLLSTTNGNDQIARAALRCAQGEKSLIDQEGKGEGKKAVNN